MTLVAMIGMQERALHLDGPVCPDFWGFGGPKKYVFLMGAERVTCLQIGVIERPRRC